MKLFILTVRFLTRIPLPLTEDGEVMEQKEFSKGILFFPLVGLLVGGCCYFFYWLASLIDPGMFPVLICVLANVFVTGAFHLDGLADTCDGVFSSRKRGQMLVIMKDSRIGTYGVLAVLFDILFRIFFLLELRGGLLFFGILLAPVAGKMATPLMLYAPYAGKEGGLGCLYLEEENRQQRIWAVFLGLFLILACLGNMGILPCCAVLLCAVLLRLFCMRVLGGITGDTLGACAELSELVFLLCLAAARRWMFYY